MSPEFSLGEFLSWCRTKPADEAYCFIDSGNCALGQFLQAERGLTERQLRAADPYECGNLSDGFKSALSGKYPTDMWTFGALVKRLEKLCPETPDYARIEAYLVDLESVGA